MCVTVTGVTVSGEPCSKKLAASSTDMRSKVKARLRESDLAALSDCGGEFTQPRLCLVSHVLTLDGEQRVCICERVLSSYVCNMEELVFRCCRLVL